MGARNTEFLCFIVDVGPHMHPLLPNVQEYLVCAIEAKLLNKLTHEVALLLFGSTDTLNEPHEEAETKGEPDQYMHIEVKLNYKLPDLASLSAADNLPRGTGYSDTLDALTVAADMVVKADAERLLGKTPKRVVLVSNFRGKGKGWDPDFRKYVVDTFMTQGVKLEVLHLDYGVDTTGAPEAEAAHRENMDGVTEVLQDMGAKEPLTVRSAADLLAAVHWVEVVPVTTYRGPLCIGKDTKIPVRVYKKVSHETLPSLKDYVVSEPGTEGNEELTFRTKKLRQWNVEGKKDELVDEDDTVTGHKYGRQAIPVDDNLESLLKYSVRDKGMWMWGFMPAERVKRYSYMSESVIIVPDPGDSGAGQAVSALVRAMHKDKQVAVVRYVARANSRPHLLVLTPLLGNLRRPDAWVGNYLPFEQDLKWVDFPPLGHNVTITADQKAACDALVDSMQLVDDTGRELLSSETTPNPVLSRFYSAIAKQAMGHSQQHEDAPGLQVPPAESDPLVQQVCQTPASVVTRASGALKRIREVFVTQEVVKPKPEEQDAGKRAKSAIGLDEDEDRVVEGGAAGAGGAAGGAGVAAVHHVGTATPEDDFAVLLAMGQAKAAVEEMQQVIQQLVDESVGSRNYDKAAGCEAALRRGCVEHRLAAEYNQHLRALAVQYKFHEAHAAFFTRLVNNRVTLVTEQEAPGCAGAVSEQEAEAFLREHTAAQPASVAAPVEQAGDDFDEME